MTPYPSPTGDGWRPTHRHIKTGRLYRALTDAELESDLSPVMVYQGADGRVWVRPRDEFHDFDRFELLDADVAGSSPAGEAELVVPPDQPVDTNKVIETPAPEEDYAGLVERLRRSLFETGADLPTVVRERRRAADAIEKLVGERDELKHDLERYMEIANEHFNEADSLKAENEELVEERDKWKERCEYAWSRWDEAGMARIKNMVLSKKLSALKAENTNLVKERDTWHRATYSECKARQGMEDLYEKAMSERDSLRAEKERLKEALKPFADLADHLCVEAFDSHETRMHPVSCGDLQRARAVLSTGPYFPDILDMKLEALAKHKAEGA